MASGPLSQPHRLYSPHCFLMPKGLMVSQRSWQSPVTPTVRMLPYLAPTSKPHPTSTPQTLHPSKSPMIPTLLPVLFDFTSLDISGTLNRVDSSPFQSTLLFWFTWSHLSQPFPISLPLPPPLDLTCKCWRACLAQGFVLGSLLLLHSLGNFIFPWLPNLLLQPKSLLSVPDTTTYMIFPLGWLTGISNLNSVLIFARPELLLSVPSHFYYPHLYAHNPRG